MMSRRTQLVLTAGALLLSVIWVPDTLRALSNAGPVVLAAPATQAVAAQAAPPATTATTVVRSAVAAGRDQDAG